MRRLIKFVGRVIYRIACAIGWYFIGRYIHRFIDDVLRDLRKRRPRPT